MKTNNEIRMKANEEFYDRHYREISKCTRRVYLYRVECLGIEPAIALSSPMIQNEYKKADEYFANR